MLKLHRHVEQRIVFLAHRLEHGVTGLLHELGARVVVL